MQLAEVSIRRPVFAVMLIAGLVALGWISWGRLGVDLFPKVEFPFVVVTTTLEGASPDTVETEVTDPLEEQLNTISGVNALRSVSSEGLSQVFIEFELEEDPDVKAQEVRDRVSLAQRDLPSDVNPPVVQKVDPDADPILSIMVSGALSPRELTAFADATVKRRLERIPGVGSVTLVGGRDREIRIWLDAQRLRAYGVTAEDVINALRREHAEIPGGRMETAGEASELTVKTKGEVTSVDGFGDIVVAYRANGVPTLVRDVATVQDGLEDERTYADLNGQPGVSLEVRRQSGQNTLQVANAVKTEVEKLRPLLPPGTDMIVARDVSKFIQASRDDVFKDIWVAVGVVTLVVFAFLTSVRATVIVFTAIPTSLISTFFLFYVADFSINMQSLMALQLAVGLLVDDAIVVLEAIHRKLEEGRSPVQAAVEGTSQVGMAVIAGTLSVCAVFVPIAFMEGMVGRFFYEYGMAIAFSVLVSLLVSLTLTPLMSSRLLRLQHQKGPVVRGLEAYHAFVDRRYARILRWSVTHTKTVSLLAAATIVGGFMVAAMIPSGFFSKADRSEFLGVINLPQGTGIQTAKDVGARVAAGLKDIPHVRDVFFTIGGGQDQRVNRISYYIALTPKSDRPITSFAIEEQARAVMTRLAPEATNLAVTEVPWVGGMGVEYNVMFSFEGPELAVLQEKTDAIMARLRQTGLFSDMRSSFESGRPEVQFAIDRERAADLSVGVRTLATTVRAMVGGVDAGTFEDGGERYDVRVRLADDQRDDIAKLSLIQVRAADGQVIDIGNVARIGVEEGPAQIDRRNRARAITLQMNLAPGVPMGPAVEELHRIVAAVGLPEGYRYSPFGQVERMAETGKAILFAFGLALLALYMVLASQFNSYGQPLIMMLAAPLSFFGAFVGLLIAGMEMTMFAQIGLIALMGIVLKNGILLVDHANVAREERGLSYKDAMIEAGETRLRPVLMTALTMIFGMLPAIFSTSQGAEMRAPMAVLVVGGMVSSTVLTLVVVPAIYVMTGAWGARAASVKRWITERARKLAGAPPPGAPAE